MDSHQQQHNQETVYQIAYLPATTEAWMPPITTTSTSSMNTTMVSSHCCVPSIPITTPTALDELNTSCSSYHSLDHMPPMNDLSPGNMYPSTTTATTTAAAATVTTTATSPGGEYFYTPVSETMDINMTQVSMTPLVAPLDMNPYGIADAVSRMQIQEHHHPSMMDPHPTTTMMTTPPMIVHDQVFVDSQQQPQEHRLSLDIQPCISITEPTPIKPQAHQRHSDFLFADPFAPTHTNAHHHQQQQPMLDPSFMDSTQPQDWLSWTPTRGSSPDIYFDTSSVSSDPTINNSTTPMPQSQQQQQQKSSPVLPPTTPAKLAAPTRSTKNRPRRVSEPPKASRDITENNNGQQINGGGGNKIRRSSSERKTRNAPGAFFCQHPGCGKSFTRAYNLTSHMRTHTSERPFPCSQCGRRFARQHDRNRHEKLHWGIKPFTCANCKKSFARMDALNRHLRVENGCGTVLGITNASEMQ